MLSPASVRIGSMDIMPEGFGYDGHTARASARRENRTAVGRGFSFARTTRGPSNSTGRAQGLPGNAGGGGFLTATSLR